MTHYKVTLTNITSRQTWYVNCASSADAELLVKDAGGSIAEAQASVLPSEFLPVGIGELKPDEPTMGMTDKPKRPRDANQLAKFVVDVECAAGVGQDQAAFLPGVRVLRSSNWMGLR